MKEQTEEQPIWTIRPHLLRWILTICLFWWLSLIGMLMVGLWSMVLDCFRCWWTQIIIPCITGEEPKEFTSKYLSKLI